MEWWDTRADDVAMDGRRRERDEEGEREEEDEEEEEGEGREKRTGVMRVIHLAQVLWRRFHSTTPLPRLSRIDLGRSVTSLKEMEISK